MIQRIFRSFEHNNLGALYPPPEGTGFTARVIKLEVAPFTHYGPGFLAPRVGVFQKEVARHADANEFAGAIFEITLTISLDGNCAVGGAVDAAPVLPARFVQSVHVAVLAAFAYFDATVPGIPNVVHSKRKLNGEFPISHGKGSSEFEAYFRKNADFAEPEFAVQGFACLIFRRDALLSKIGSGKITRASP